MVVTAPVEISIFFSDPPAKNATKRLSGDQNGENAPSVPDNARAEMAFTGRSCSENGAPGDRPGNARWRPSGETATLPRLFIRVGRLSWKRMDSAGSELDGRLATTNPAV